MPRLTWVIGDVVRKEREMRKWTQADCAARAHIDRTALGRIENGGNFTQQTLAQVAKAFRLTVPELYAEIPPKEWPVGDELEAWRLFRGIKDPALRAQALELLARFSTVKRPAGTGVAEAR